MQIKKVNEDGLGRGTGLGRSLDLRVREKETAGGL